MAEKTERKKKGKVRGALSHAVTVILCLVLMLSVFVAAVLLQSAKNNELGRFVVEEEKETVKRMQSATMTDIKALAQMFGAPLPYLPNVSATGESSNTVHDGETVRVCKITYPGVVVTAMRPASAAPLLLRKAMFLTTRDDLKVLDLSASLAERANSRCAYFVTEQAAYSVYAPDMAQDDFLRVLGNLGWIE